VSYLLCEHLELLSLLYDLLAKVRKEGLMSIESDVETPDQSPIFTKYPMILEDHHAMDFLVDYLRLMVGGQKVTIRLACIDAPEMPQAPYLAPGSIRSPELSGEEGMCSRIGPRTTP
jgi:endonuclease YncB( thermonuclease family)